MPYNPEANRENVKCVGVVDAFPAGGVKLVKDGRVDDGYQCPGNIINHENSDGNAKKCGGEKEKNNPEASRQLVYYQKYLFLQEHF